MNSRNSFYFILCSLIWGTTWWAIKFQIGAVSPAVGVFYRFSLSSLIMFIFAKFKGHEMSKYTFHHHAVFFFQGFFNYCLNYILTYKAEQMANSAYIALTFTSLLYFNMVGLKFWFKRSISTNVILGGILGAIGLVLIFWKEIQNTNITYYLQTKGILIGILATFFASIGNMFGNQNHLNKVPVLVFTSFGMLYGAIVSLIISFLLQEPFYFPTNNAFLVSLLYLSIFGTVIAFWSYQNLIGNIGADKAAFTSIISPVIATILSSYLENLILTPKILVGVGLCISGNFIALWKKTKTNITIKI